VLIKQRVMTSSRKTGAKRRNALKSTGPKTREGRAAVRLNALRHGQLSREVLLCPERTRPLWRSYASVYRWFVDVGGGPLAPRESLMWSNGSVFMGRARYFDRF
jgi:hypothetical protein